VTARQAGAVTNLGTDQVLAAGSCSPLSKAIETAARAGANLRKLRKAFLELPLLTTESVGSRARSTAGDRLGLGVDGDDEGTAGVGSVRTLPRGRLSGSCSSAAR
jgi:hypothetical protein